jgi:uncharacterized protein YndB with AHSA1/START domain
MGSEKLAIVRTVAAPVGEVFAAWTRPELLSQWFAPGTMTAEVAELDPRPGGRFRIAMHDPASGDRHIVSGVYREVAENERLVFTWSWEGLAAPETLVSVLLRGQGDATEVLLTHEGFPTAELRESHQQGWAGSTQKLVDLFVPTPT